MTGEWPAVLILDGDPWRPTAGIDSRSPAERARHGAAFEAAAASETGWTIALFPILRYI
jgi:hypothetical protein